MSLTSRLPRTLVVAAALVGALVAAAPAAASEVSLAGGTLTLFDQGTIKNKLEPAGIKVGTLNAGHTTGRTLFLPIRDGAVETVDKTGRARMHGGIFFHRGNQGYAEWRALSVRFTPEGGVLQRRSRGRTFDVARISAQDRRVFTDSRGITRVKDLRMTLTVQAAADLNRRLNTTVFESRRVFWLGSLNSDAPAGPNPPCGPLACPGADTATQAVHTG